ncbi:hypothetical protein [Candidatus Chrysopegis kryptomonas]|jgi:hypothetical protein|uniref:Cytochrome c domain-containing protein n=1 Tax=Candidatus Chryseopegocella kryptomonas TaxID=1633643 RepID=A0A0P1MZD6_9BACT|nr:hypothetical protein [Candidatus Chrysopegis kryptomonas]CUT01466.1 hypothetical protein JGI23_01047 [Candidatus Chrysopegis kryptomonas]
MKKAIFLTLIFFAGCYTIIKHPEISYTGSSGETYTSYVNYRSNCASCHSLSELAYYYEFIPAHTSSPWVYYNTPWWFWWINNPPDTSRGQGSTPIATPERTRDFGSHRSTGNESFSPPPPTRTPPKSGADTTPSSTSSIGKSDTTKSNDGRNTPSVRSSNEGSREQSRESNTTEEAKRKIGSRRK